MFAQADRMEPLSGHTKGCANASNEFGSQAQLAYDETELARLADSHGVRVETLTVHPVSGRYAETLSRAGRNRGSGRIPRPALTANAV